MTNAPNKAPDQVERNLRDKIKKLIGDQVLQGLGTPGDLVRVQVRFLWTNHYRANVLVGADVASARVAHSYFLVADDDGRISASTPKIAKHY
jgi:hypothetical protein